MKTKKTTIKKGFFIVIDGADGAGKTVQTEQLVQALRGRGISVTTFDFPNYTTNPAGKLIGEALKGKHGNFRTMSPHIAALPYVVDRAIEMPRLRAVLSKGGCVVANRFTSSNIAYQAAKATGSRAKQEVIRFIEHLEYISLGFPWPNLTIYLDVPPSVSAKLLVKKAARAYLGKEKGLKDQHEADVSYQRAVGKMYRTLARGWAGDYRSWCVIKCGNGKGGILPVSTIHQKIIEAVQRRLPQQWGDKLIPCSDGLIIPDATRRALVELQAMPKG